MSERILELFKILMICRYSRHLHMFIDLYFLRPNFLNYHILLQICW